MTIDPKTIQVLHHGRKPGPRPASQLYHGLHSTYSLDRLLRVLFHIRRFPRLKSRIRDIHRATSDGLLDSLQIQAHQAQHVAQLAIKGKLPEPARAAWDLTEEAAHECLVASLLARMGLIPQGVAHLRRHIELLIEAGFLSTSSINLPGGRWEPFTELYLTDLWLHYAADRPLTLGEFSKTVRSRGLGVGDALRDFTAVYLVNFTRPSCGSHHEGLRRQHVGRGMYLPLYYTVPESNERCSFEGCDKPMASMLIDRPPNIELMQEVVRANLEADGYSPNMHKALETLYDTLSRFVHVTREAHRHSPSWVEDEVKTWGHLLRSVSSWGLRYSHILWKHHRSGLPGLTVLLEQIRYDTFGARSGQIRRRVCGLYLATLRPASAGTAHEPRAS